MKVRKCREGIECIYNEEAGGVIILCPLCSDVWEQEDQTTASCQHVRFFYSTFVQEIVYFGEDWDSASFDESFRELAHFNDDECIEEDQAFRDIIHPDVDAVVFYVQDEVMGSWAQYWGYKT